MVSSVTTGRRFFAGWEEVMMYRMHTVRSGCYDLKGLIISVADWWQCHFALVLLFTLVSKLYLDSIQSGFSEIKKTRN